MNEHTYFEHETHISAKYIKRVYNGLFLEIGENKKIIFNFGNPALDWMAYVDYITPRKTALTENYCDVNLHEFAKKSNYKWIWIVFDENGDRVADKLQIKRLMATGTMTYISPSHISTYDDLKKYCNKLQSKKRMCNICKQKVENKMIYDVNGGLCISCFNKEKAK